MGILNLGKKLKVPDRHREEEKKELEELGIIPKEEKSIVAKTIEILKVLKANSVDLSKIKTGSRKKRYLLKELRIEGIDIEKIIRENELDGDFKFGQAIGNVRQAYKGEGGYKITEEEKKELEELGIIKTKITRPRNRTSSI